MTTRHRPSADCRVRLLELSRYLDSDLTAARRRTIERHLAACACCKTMAWRLELTRVACRTAKGRPLPRKVRLRAAERIRALLARRRR
jgi:anti-sigma factor RsiW